MNSKPRILVIDGLMGEGKTFLATVCARFYEPDRVFSNVDIKYKNKQRSINYKSMHELWNIVQYDRRHGLIILDEGGFNASSRKSFSKENLLLSKLGMLSRKVNVDILVIGQDQANIDINIRKRLGKFVITMNMFIDKNGTPVFKEEVKENKYGQQFLLGYKTLNLIKIAKKMGLDYNTLDTSELDI